MIFIYSKKDAAIRPYIKVWKIMMTKDSNKKKKILKLNKKKELKLFKTMIWIKNNLNKKIRSNKLLTWPLELLIKNYNMNNW